MSLRKFLIKIQFKQNITKGKCIIPFLFNKIEHYHCVNSKCPSSNTSNTLDSTCNLGSFIGGKTPNLLEKNYVFNQSYKLGYIDAFKKGFYELKFKMFFYCSNEEGNDCLKSEDNLIVSSFLQEQLIQRSHFNYKNNEIRIGDRKWVDKSIIINVTQAYRDFEVFSLICKFYLLIR